MNWKSRIQALMALGLSVDDVATRMGVTGNAVREILSGRTQAPRAEAAIALLVLCEEHEIKDAQAA